MSQGPTELDPSDDHVSRGPTELDPSDDHVSRGPTELDPSDDRVSRGPTDRESVGRKADPGGRRRVPFTLLAALAAIAGMAFVAQWLGLPLADRIPLPLPMTGILALALAWLAVLARIRDADRPTIDPQGVRPPDLD